MTTNTVNNSKGMEKYFFRASALDFNKIPARPIAYWLSNSINNVFSEGTPLKSVGDTRQGMATSDNNRFLRLWFEVAYNSIFIGAENREMAAKSGMKWFPYNKGGDYRKWFGNLEHIVNWENDGEELLEYAASLYGSPTRTIKSISEYFKPSVSWSKISSGNLAMRFYPAGFLFDVAGCSIFTPSIKQLYTLIGFTNTTLVRKLLEAVSPTLNFEAGQIASLPLLELDYSCISELPKRLITQSKKDWNSYETSWDFTTLPLLQADYRQTTLAATYQSLRAHWQENTLEMQRLEEENNRIFIEAYGLQDELTPEVPLNEITLTCNPHYRYRLGKQWDGASEEERNAELERQLQSDTLCELISYAIGCMMGRYSIDQPGLILASQGETLQDYLERVPNPRFLPDDDAIVPLTDQEWFADDATHRVREFVRTVWGEQHLQENLDFIAESLCLSAIRPRKGESSLDCIRRYLSTQFYKDHMRTYKKRPIYWLFSSGKLKAFECLVYLHRYTEGTLARMRTQYVIPLTARLHSHGERLEEARANSTSAAETKRLEKELDQLHKQQAELAEFDEQLRHYADQRIRLNLDDGVKVNYGKFGNLLADVKAIAG